MFIYNSTLLLSVVSSSFSTSYIYLLHSMISHEKGRKKNYIISKNVLIVHTAVDNVSQVDEKKPFFYLNSFFIHFLPFHILSQKKRKKNHRKIVNGNHHNQHPRNFYGTFFFFPFVASHIAKRFSKSSLVHCVLLRGVCSAEFIWNVWGKWFFFVLSAHFTVSKHRLSYFFPFTEKKGERGKLWVASNSTVI